MWRIKEHRRVDKQVASIPPEFYEKYMKEVHETLKTFFIIGEAYENK